MNFGGIDYKRLNSTLTNNSVLLTPKLPTDTLNVPKIYYISTEDTQGSSDIVIAHNQRQLLIQTLTALGFEVTYNEKDNSLYLVNYQSMRIVDISNVFSTSPWENGNYDAICSFNDKYKVLDVTTKYASNSGDIVLDIKRTGSITKRVISGPYDQAQSLDNKYEQNKKYVLGSSITSEYLNYGDYSQLTKRLPNKYFLIELFDEYRINISQVNSNNYSINSETFDVSFDQNSDNFIDEILERESNLIKSKLYFNGYLKSGIYRFNRSEDYAPDDTDVLINMINIDVSELSFELLVDSGVLVRSSQSLIRDKYQAEYNRHFLSLFDAEGSKLDSLDYNGMLSTKCSAFSSPHIIIDDIEYPAYLAFLMNSINKGTYSDEIGIDKLSSSPSDLITKNLMSIYYDKYRYVLTHNYINSDIGRVVPEVILILARIENYLYRNINYTDTDNIIDRFVELVNEIRAFSGDVLLDIFLEDIKIRDRTCYLVVVIKFELFRADPINIRTTLNVTI
jgi:hypothetical protein